MFAKAAKALAALAVLVIMSCSKGGVIEEIHHIEPSSIDALKFTCQTQDNEQERNARSADGKQTRASQLLTTGFMVNTYKAYGLSTQFTVMNAYNVEYKTTGTAWDGNIRPYWDYTTVKGQYEKYWDYSAFPYRFHAVAPFPTTPSTVLLSDASLNINATYRMQTALNGMVTPTDREAEPYLAAQLQRNTNGRDYDLLATTHPKEINTGSQTRNRYVELPFHHLNSKVRFGIYSTTPWTTANPLYIEDMTISVYSPNFVTQATGYHSDGTTTAPTLPGTSTTVLDAPGTERSWYLGTGNSGFNGLTKVQLPTTHTQLLRFDGGRDVTGNDLSLHQGRASAFWLQCPQGIMQLPQEDVQLCVTFNLRSMDGTLYKSFNDIPIQMEDGTRQYNWLSGYIHTYYLIIGDIDDRLELSFTATLTPWEDISGSLTTDLEQ